MIRKHGRTYTLYSRKTGRKLGTFTSLEKAKKREKQIQSDRCEKPGELQTNHNHAYNIFVAVMPLFAQCNMHYW